MALKKNKEQENVFNLSFVINCEHKNMTETDKIEHRLKTVLTDFVPSTILEKYKKHHLIRNTTLK